MWPPDSLVPLGPSSQGPARTAETLSGREGPTKPALPALARRDLLGPRGVDKEA